MNSAPARRRHRARQSAVVLAGIGVTATGAVAGLAHASPQVAGLAHASPPVAGYTTSAAGSSSVAPSSLAPSSASARSSSPVQPGIAGGAPQAQSGGS